MRTKLIFSDELSKPVAEFASPEEKAAFYAEMDAHFHQSDNERERDWDNEAQRTDDAAWHSTWEEVQYV